MIWFDLAVTKKDNVQISPFHRENSNTLLKLFSFTISTDCQISVMSFIKETVFWNHLNATPGLPRILHLNRNQTLTLSLQKNWKAPAMVSSSFFSMWRMATLMMCVGSSELETEMFCGDFERNCQWCDHEHN